MMSSLVEEKARELSGCTCGSNEGCSNCSERQRLEEALREAEKRGARRAIEHIYERFRGYKPEAAGYISRHVRIGDVLDHDDQEVDDG